MRMYDLIMKKRNGEALTEQEIQYMIREYVAGEIPDYQMSAFLMGGLFQRNDRGRDTCDDTGCGAFWRDGRFIRNRGRESG